MISIVIISKDEASLDGTLTAVTLRRSAWRNQPRSVVVDASDRTDSIISGCVTRSEVRWVQFDQPPGVTVTIPHQRNAGVR